MSSSSSARLPTPQGPGSVSGAPDLPDGFARTFTSRYVDTGELRQHVFTGGEGPPLLLAHGWPQTWYAWRLMMPALARSFSVVAPDQRGRGLFGKPAGGYDTATLAGDLVALMDALGHERFAVAGHDVGVWIGYALAADHPGRVDRLAVAEAAMPGVSDSPPLFGTSHANDRLWHFAEFHHPYPSVQTCVFTSNPPKIDLGGSSSMAETRRWLRNSGGRNPQMAQTCWQRTRSFMSV
jgi:pimeloyl-ACP methyl ester carboxylesterase